MDKTIQENNKLFSKILYIVALSVFAVMFIAECIVYEGMSFGYVNLILVYGLIGLVLFFAKNENSKKYAILALAVVLLVNSFLSLNGFDWISNMFDWNVPYAFAFLIGMLASIFAFVVMVLFVLQKAFGVNISDKFFSLSLQILLIAVLAEFVLAFIGSAMTWGDEYKIFPWYQFLGYVPTFCFLAYIVLNKCMLTGETTHETPKTKEVEEKPEEEKEESEEKEEKKTTKKSTKKSK